MDRRAFLESMLKVAAATALPSEVWPFRKIFLPPAPPVVLVEQMQNFSVVFDPTIARWAYLEGILLRAAQ
jgi:hypothetical protein